MSRPRIVLADAYEPLAAACANLLRAEYDVVAVVTSGEAALATVRAEDPDALVIDASLPGRNGFAVARELSGCGTRTKIVMLSSHRDPAIVDEALASGALAHVAKAHIARDLIPGVRAVLAGKQYLSSLDPGNGALSGL